MTAAEYVEAELEAGRLTWAHIVELVRQFQMSHELLVDGKPGPFTRAKIDDDMREREMRSTPVPVEPTLPAERCWPLRALPDGRKPVVTSGYRHPLRPLHVGVDIFYAWLQTDPPIKIGDGGRTAKWWIPDNQPAIAVSNGRIVTAGWTTTGYHVRLALEGGYSVGYFHLSRLLVAVGQHVLIGQPVGIVGDNPADTDARHLHFELYHGERGWSRIDPDRLLREAKVLASS